MTCFVTVALAFDRAKADAVDAHLETYAYDLQESAGAVRTALRRQGVHFMSITVVRGDVGEPTHLLIEFSADGEEDGALALVERCLQPQIAAILAVAGIAAPPPLAKFLRRHAIHTGQGLLDVPGLNFCGTPGMSVGRILDEYALARFIRCYFDKHSLGGSPLATVREIRAAVAKDAALAPLLAPEPVPALPVKSGLGGGLDPALLLSLFVPALTNFFWPVLLVLGIGVAAATVAAWLKAGATTGLLVLATTLCLAVFALVLVAVLAYLRLHKLEAANQPDNSVPNRTVLADVLAHEDWAAQNHLAGVSVMQGGWFRRVTLRLAFWVILQLALAKFRPGFLADIGTIHYARWVLLPRTNKLLFFSNYGGSWESYLEDFITKAASGLTGVWSNTVGYPKTSNLFQQGATDGERFKLWARRQQRPTRFWYTAYPRLTTLRIRANAAIRLGLATASTEDEAQAWLGLFASGVRPAALIETPDVQTLLFGGLGYHPSCACLGLKLPDGRAAAQAWLKGALPDITFGDQALGDCAQVLGLTAGGLSRLGLGADTLEQFPMAFLQGMDHPVRAKMLADTGSDKPATWLWGAEEARVDAALLVYCRDRAALDAKVAALAAALAAAGGRLVHRVTAADLPQKPPGEKRRFFPPEPFGYSDGVSQPIVRGTRRWARETDAIHAVEPGEFLYGYPDNRGYRPPSPSVRATQDPDNILTVQNPLHSVDVLQPDFSASGANQDRDFGRNGTFLVIRQLEQDVETFNAYLDQAALEHANHPGMPKEFDAAQRALWLGAKMNGRWKDGTSLVRHPNRPGRGWDGKGGAEIDNDFLFGAEDPLGERCPYGAHIRRGNPRESLQPGSSEQVAITNRHRMLRVGRAYRPQDSGDPAAVKPGIVFMCLNGDIERQFEFVQQTWITALQFHGLENEVDPLLTRGKATRRLTVPTAEGPLLLRGFQDFVRMRGGGYFFLPGKRALQYLAQAAG